MSDPYEIMTGPISLYWGPVGESFPDVDEAPAGNWALVGSSGAENYSEDGVRVQHNQTIEKIRMLGSTGPKKARRTEEDLMISVTMADLTLEQYSLALNNNTVTDTAAGSGTPGFQDADIYRGIDVSLMALLIRSGYSPYGATWSMQWQIPVCYVDGSPEPTFTKSGAAGLLLSFTALEDPDAAAVSEKFGTIIAQDATAS